MTGAAPDDDENDDGPPQFPGWMWRMLLGAFVVFVGWGLYMRMQPAIAPMGQWADSFGPLTGALSGVALVFVVWSSHMQRRELDLTRKEMAAQRVEMEAQRLAQEKSALEQERANKLASRANDLILSQLEAQRQALVAQERANTLAEVASSIAIAQGQLDAYRFAASAGEQIGLNVSTVDKMLRKAAGENEGVILRKAADMIAALRELAPILEGERGGQ